METFDRGPDDPERDRIRVGVSEYVTVGDGETLVAYGLGSTVGVALYAPETGAGGLSNAVLPRRREGDDGAAAKFVDSAVQAMVKDLAEAGTMIGSLEAYVVGGARIMDLGELETGVGAENVRAAREELGGLGIPVVAEAVGGDRGRTVAFDTATGTVTVETVDRGPEPLSPG
jgi:chemotaxis protein CheD